MSLLNFALAAASRVVYRLLKLRLSFTYFAVVRFSHEICCFLAQNLDAFIVFWQLLLLNLRFIDSYDLHSQLFGSTHHSAVFFSAHLTPPITYVKCFHVVMSL